TNTRRAHYRWSSCASTSPAGGHSGERTVTAHKAGLGSRARSQLTAQDLEIEPFLAYAEIVIEQREHTRDERIDEEAHERDQHRDRGIQPARQRARGGPQATRAQDDHEQER